MGHFKMRCIFIPYVILYLGHYTMTVTCQGPEDRLLFDFDRVLLPQESSAQGSAQCISTPTCDPACLPGQQEFILNTPPCGECFCIGDSENRCQPPMPCNCPPDYAPRIFNDPVTECDICTCVQCPKLECSCGFGEDSRIFEDPNTGCPACECIRCPQPFCVCQAAGEVPTTFTDLDSGCPTCGCIQKCPQPPFGCPPGEGTELYTDISNSCPTTRCVKCPEVSCSCLPWQKTVVTLDIRGCPICSCGSSTNPCTRLECACVEEGIQILQ